MQFALSQSGLWPGPANPEAAMQQRGMNQGRRKEIVNVVGVGWLPKLFFNQGFGRKCLS